MPVKDFLGRELATEDLVYYCTTGGGGEMRIGKIESIEFTHREVIGSEVLKVTYKVKVKPIGIDGLGTEGMRRVTIRSNIHPTRNLEDGASPTTPRIARIGNMAELANPAESPEIEEEPESPGLSPIPDLAIAEGITFDDLRPRGRPLRNENGDLFVNQDLEEQYRLFSGVDVRSMVAGQAIEMAPISYSIQREPPFEGHVMTPESTLLD